MLLQFYVLFTGDRKYTAGWLVGNSVVKGAVTFIYEGSAD